jgi:hypothetical protein
MLAQIRELCVMLHGNIMTSHVRNEHGAHAAMAYLMVSNHRTLFVQWEAALIKGISIWPRPKENVDLSAKR